MAPVFLQLNSFWNTWTHSDSRSSCVAKASSESAGHAGLPRNELANLLTKNWSNTSLRRCSQPASPSYCKDKKNPLYYLETKSFSQFSLLPSDELGLLCLARCEQTLLPWSQPSFVLLPRQDKIKGEFLQNLQSSVLQDLAHLLLDCFAPEPLRCTIFGH